MRASVVVLALCMLLTGTINTIATKYQDIIVIGYGPDGTPITFRHPAVQSACMFLGESLCLIPYFIMRWRRRKAKRRDPAYVPMPAQEKRSRRIGRIMAFAVPTLCDAMGTSLMNIGLFYTYASTYQMLRGTLVLFAGAFTVLILRRQLFIHHWLGMVLITAGAALVGASSVLYQDHPGSSNLLSAGGLMHPAGWAPAPTSPGGSWQAAGQPFGGGVRLLNATAAGLHYDPGVSRVASRGMLGMLLPGGMAQLGTGIAAAAASAAGGTSSSGSSGHGGGDVSVDPFAAGSGLRPGVVPGLHVWSAALREGGDVAAAPLFGDLLVVGAQMFTALQFILEEKFLVKYKVPALLAVGLEGCWGLVLCAFLLPVTTLVRGPDGVPLDDAPAAFRAIWSNLELGGAVYLSIFSIAFFNFFGVSVTKSLSGAARATIDACRTVFIWLYALHAGWESFHALEVVGFVVLISGTSLYNEIIKSCLPGTSVDSGRQTPLPRHSRSRRPRSSGAARDSAAGDGAALAVPLLQGEAEADAEKGPAAAAAAGAVLSAAPPAAGAAGAAGAQPAGRGRTAPPVPLRRPAPAHSRAAAAEAGQSTGGSGSWAYHMARSMRLGIHTLSPQSLAAAGGLAEGDDGETSDVDGDDSVSESGSSYYSSSVLGGSSLGRSMDGGVGGGLSGSLRGGAGSGGSRGGALAAYADAGGSGSGVMVLRGFEGAAGDGSSSLSSRPPAAAVGVGGLTASLQQAAGSSRLRAASPATGTPPLPRQPSSGSLRRQSSSGNVRGAGSSQQQQQQQ